MARPRAAVRGVLLRDRFRGHRSAPPRVRVGEPLAAPARCGVCDQLRHRAGPGIVGPRIPRAGAGTLLPDVRRRGCRALRWHGAGLPRHRVGVGGVRRPHRAAALAGVAARCRVCALQDRVARDDVARRRGHRGRRRGRERAGAGSAVVAGGRAEVDRSRWLCLLGAARPARHVPDDLDAARTHRGEPTARRTPTCPARSAGPVDALLRALRPLRPAHPRQRRHQQCQRGHHRLRRCRRTHGDVPAPVADRGRTRQSTRHT